MLQALHKHHYIIKNKYMDKKTKQELEKRGLSIREVKKPQEKFVYMITTADNPDIQTLNQSGRFFNKKKLKISGRSKRKVVEMTLTGSADAMLDPLLKEMQKMHNNKDLHIYKINISTLCFENSTINIMYGRPKMVK